MKNKRSNLTHLAAKRNHLDSAAERSNGTRRIRTGVLKIRRDVTGLTELLHRAGWLR